LRWHIPFRQLAFDTITNNETFRSCRFSAPAHNSEAPTPLLSEGDAIAIILHIVQRDEWATARAAGFYWPKAFPADGFIHCSTPEQVVQVANLRFRGQSGFVLLVIDTDKVDAEIIYENLEGGQQLFPHIYGQLNCDAVIKVVEFEPDAQGDFALPESIRH